MECIHDDIRAMYFARKSFYNNKQNMTKIIKDFISIKLEQ